MLSKIVSKIWSRLLLLLISTIFILLIWAIYRVLYFLQVFLYISEKYVQGYLVMNSSDEVSKNIAFRVATLFPLAINLLNAGISHVAN